MRDAESLGQLAHAERTEALEQIHGAEPALLEAESEGGVDLEGLAVDALREAPQAAADGGRALAAGEVVVGGCGHLANSVGAYLYWRRPTRNERPRS